jgi:hypothetical protein
MGSREYSLRGSRKEEHRGAKCCSVLTKVKLPRLPLSSASHATRAIAVSSCGTITSRKGTPGAQVDYDKMAVVTVALDSTRSHKILGA